jgi:hypothetical protein
MDVGRAEFAIMVLASKDVGFVVDRCHRVVVSSEREPGEARWSALGLEDVGECKRDALVVIGRKSRNLRERALQGLRWARKGDCDASFDAGRDDLLGGHKPSDCFCHIDDWEETGGWGSRCLGNIGSARVKGCRFVVFLLLPRFGGAEKLMNSQTRSLVV